MILRTLALALLLAAPAAAETPAKALFGEATTPSPHPSEPLGSYAGGCLAGGVELPETGPSWAAMRPSRNRHWGHPELIDFVRDLSREAARIGWAGLLVGDMSQPRGGPMPYGHRSHQIGLDVDVWMRPARDVALSRRDRELMPFFSVQRDDGAHVGRGWTPEHAAILRAAASDPRVARIFVFPGAKVWMCENVGADRDWLRQIRPWWGHHEHFHVRLRCPDGAAGCTDQAPPPPGDGCDEALSWQRDILAPAPPPDPDAPPPSPRPDLTMADLPGACGAVLSAE